MYKKSHELSVGIFVLIAIIGMLFLAFKVSGLSTNTFNTKTYAVYADFTDIGNLRQNAAVRIAGVEIGTVKSIELNTSYTGFVAKVTMNINQQFNQIPNDYAASIQTSGILGDSFIALTPPQMNLPANDQDPYLHNGSMIPLENTTSAMNLNALISTFASSGDNK